MTTVPYRKLHGHVQHATCLHAPACQAGWRCRGRLYGRRMAYCKLITLKMCAGRYLLALEQACYEVRGPKTGRDTRTQQQKYSINSKFPSSLSHCQMFSDGPVAQKRSAWCWGQSHQMYLRSQECERAKLCRFIFAWLFGHSSATCRCHEPQLALLKV